MKGGAFLLLVVMCVVGCSYAQVPLYNTSTWMQQMGDKIYSRSLLDLTLPGTHDSGKLTFFLLYSRKILQKPPSIHC
jgi:hypothetical protein